MIYNLLTQTELGKMILTALVAMVPVLELRGAIPFGVALGLEPHTSFFASLIGNMIPIPFAITFLRRIFSWLRIKNAFFEKIISKLERRAELKAETVKKYEFWGLFIFVGIPLPGTGAWTGALIAGILDMRLKRSVPSIFLGVLFAGILILGLTYGFQTIL